MGGERPSVGWTIFLRFSKESKLYESSSGGNQVDGLPPSAMEIVAAKSAASVEASSLSGFKQES